MKKLLIILGTILVVGFVGFYGFRAYTKLASPEAHANYDKNGLKIHVFYCQPAKKNRNIFGEVVPFGKVWRTGANETSEITFSKDVNIVGKPLKAGTYTLYTVPNADTWAVIFNTKLGTWGHFNYDEKNNALMVQVPVSSRNEVLENFTISLQESGENVNMVLEWDKTQISVPITQ